MPCEMTIAETLVDKILARGLEISLEAEGEPLLENTREKRLIMKEINACDYTVVRADDAGWFLLVWGNDEDIISDYSDNPMCNEIVKEVENEIYDCPC